jgi:hypothetical protein
LSHKRLKRHNNFWVTKFYPHCHCCTRQSVHQVIRLSRWDGSHATTTRLLSSDQKK